MNYQDVLQKLEKFREVYVALCMKGNKGSRDELYTLYGALEEIINRFAGIDEIRVESASGSRTLTFPNLISARLFSGRTSIQMKHTLNL
jgi:hypothetical protein